jgi:hypothetical protein
MVLGTGGFVIGRDLLELHSTIYLTAQWPTFWERKGIAPTGGLEKAK